MAAAKIKRNDEVMVLSGKDKGKKGIVQRVFYDTGRVIVTGINLVKKHQKPIPNKNQPGGVIEKEASIDVSNVAIFNTTLNKVDRVGFKIQNGKKVRIFKSSGDIIK